MSCFHFRKDEASEYSLAWIKTDAAQVFADPKNTYDMPGLYRPYVTKFSGNGISVTHSGSHQQVADPKLKSGSFNSDGFKCLGSS